MTLPTENPQDAAHGSAAWSRTTTIAGWSIAGGAVLVGLIFHLATRDDTDPADALRRYADEQRRFRASDLGLPGYATPDPMDGVTFDPYTLRDFDVPAYAADDDDDDDGGDLSAAALYDDLDDDSFDDDSPAPVYLYEADDDDDVPSAQAGAVVGLDDPSASDLTASVVDVDSSDGPVPDGVRTELESLVPAFRSCLQELLDDDAGLAGRYTVQVRMMLDRNGLVLDASARGGPEPLRTCVTEATDDADFPSLPSAMTFDYSVELVSP